MLSLIKKIFRYAVKRINFTYYYLKYKILGQNVVWGKNVKIAGKLIIDGPGKVIFGDNVFIDGSGPAVTPFTHSKTAEIHIGNNTFLNGTRLSSVDKIEIGSNCLIAECSILDTDFHPVNPDERLKDMPGKSGPIKIGNNVWIAGAAFIMRNTTIGDGCTVGALSVVKGDFKDRSLISGNPAKVIKVYE